MHNYPIIFSYSNCLGEITSEVDYAVSGAGYAPLRVASTKRFDGIWEHISYENLMKGFEHIVEIANSRSSDDPSGQVAVVVHFDDFKIFDDERTVRLVGENRPFIKYVHADQETCVCVFRDGKMITLYSTQRLNPYDMMGCPICINGDSERRSYFMPFDARQDIKEIDSYLSIREDWTEFMDMAADKTYYLRTRYMNDPSFPAYDGRIMSLLYEVSYDNDTGNPYCVALGKDDIDVKRRTILDCWRRDGKQPPPRHYLAREIIGTNMFLLKDDQKGLYFLVGLKMTENELLEFMKSDLFEYLGDLKK